MKSFDLKSLKRVQEYIFITFLISFTLIVLFVFQAHRYVIARYIVQNLDGLNRPNPNARSYINILLWNKYCFANPTYKWFKQGTVSVNYGCKFKPGIDCTFAQQNESLYNKSQVVLFNLHTLDLKEFPKYRPAGQMWIYAMRESPVRTRQTSLTLSMLRFLFNASMTYMLSSDVPGPICPQFRAGNSSQWTQEKQETTRRALTNKVLNKTKLVAWFVSNCKTLSSRENYVRQLSKFIQVDIYGTCGNKSCSRENSTCNTMLERDYKFYLSFENSLCEDYVTEKLSRALNLDVLPIVLGGANYTKFVAPGTYLDVKNFTSPLHLATYLKYLNNDTEMYVDYLMRKRSMVKVQTTPTICSLCRYAHKNLYTTKRVIDLAKDWNSTKLCRTAKEFFTGIM